MAQLICDPGNIDRKIAAMMTLAVEIEKLKVCVMRRQFSHKHLSLDPNTVYHLHEGQWIPIHTAPQPEREALNRRVRMAIRGIKKASLPE